MIQPAHPLLEDVVMEHRWIARDVAKRIADHFERDYQDMLDVAEFGLVLEAHEGLSKHDPTKSKLSTWLWRKVYFYLLEVVTRGRYPRTPGVREATREFPMTNFHRENIKDTDLGTHPTSATSLSELSKEGAEYLTNPPDRAHWLDSFLQELSEEGRQMVQAIVEAPEDIRAEFIPTDNRPNLAKQRQAVRSYLIDQLDWDWHKLNRVYAEVEACL